MHRNLVRRSTCEGDVNQECGCSSSPGAFADARRQGPGSGRAARRRRCETESAEPARAGRRGPGLPGPTIPVGGASSMRRSARSTMSRKSRPSPKRCASYYAAAVLISAWASRPIRSGRFNGCGDRARCVLEPRTRAPRDHLRSERAPLAPRSRQPMRPPRRRRRRSPGLRSTRRPARPGPRDRASTPARGAWQQPWSRRKGTAGVLAQQARGHVVPSGNVPPAFRAALARSRNPWIVRRCAMRHRR